MSGVPIDERSSLNIWLQCTESGCEASFVKHHQLREHICTTHAPPGTKPYRCEYPGCGKSFLTNQKLRGHAKTHDGESNPEYQPTILTNMSQTRGIRVFMRHALLRRMGRWHTIPPGRPSSTIFAPRTRQLARTLRATVKPSSHRRACARI